MKKYIIIVLCWIPFFSFANVFKNFNPQVFSLSLSSVERAVLEDSLPFLEQLLVASGVSFENLPKYRALYTNILKNLKQEIKDLTPEKQADKALQWIHKNLFKAYQEKTSEIDILLEKGIYNCVSSSAFYNLILNDLGIETRGVLLTDHVFSEVRIQEKWYDVETTVAFGFDAGNRKEVADEFKRVTGYVYVPLSSRGKNTVFIPNRYYVALIYSNRGGVFADAKKFPEALNAFYKAVMIAPDFQEGLKNLTAGYNNYALDWMAKNNYPEAEKVLKEALSLFPNNNVLLSNQQALYTNWVNYLFEKQQYDIAMEIIEKNPKHFPENEKPNYYLVWAQNKMLKEKDYVSALTIVKEAEKKFPQVKKITDYKKYIIQEYGEFLRKQGKLEELATLFSENLSPKESAIQQSIEFSKVGRIQEAKEALLKVLAVAPDEELLRMLVRTGIEAVRQNKAEELKTLLPSIAEYLPQFPSLNKYTQELLHLVAQHYYERKNFAEGIIFFQTIKKNERLNLLANEPLGILYYNGIILPLLKEKKFAEALKELQRAIELTEKKYPLLIDTYQKAAIYYGADLYQKKDFAKAYQVYFDLLKEFPHNQSALNNFRTVTQSYIEFLKQNNPALADKIKRESDEILKNR